MNIQQFNRLDEIEKIVAIIEYGRLFAQSLENECRIFLYRLGSFYVSTSYYADDDKLKGITTFDEVEQSMPYFRRMIISIHPAARNNQFNSVN